MFGLLKTHSCGQDGSARFRRLHYCGTCKTMGRLYGQQSRVLLNYDTVFLAELLTHLAEPAQQTTAWAAAYQKFPCWALPASEAEMPIALQYAATATLVLTEYKLRDQEIDSHRRRWRWLTRHFSPAFFQARRKLRQWAFPQQQLADTLASQESREAAVQQQQLPPAAAWSYLAGPTATAASLFFAHGARVIDRPDAAAALADLGREFGTLAYWLDAWEDFGRDQERGQFNAIHAVFADGCREAAAPLQEQAQRVEECLRALPLPADVLARYTLRLRANVAAKLPRSLPVVASSCCSSRPSWAQRWQTAKQLARQWSTAEEAGPVLLGVVTLLAAIAPHQVKQAQSVQECLGLPFHLMFWGSLLTPLALCGPTRRIPPNAVDQYGRPIVVVQQRGPGCCTECVCCCDICACECCACETCACEECCGSCCS